MIKFIKKVLNRALFYDRWTCNVCNKEIFKGYFCSDCQSKITFITKNKCLHCGRATPYPVNYCNSCTERNINFDKALSVFDYKKPVSLLIQNFKYQNRKYLGDYFSKELYTLYKNENLSCDLVAFVPMHPDRLKERGYNQAEFLAQRFSALSNVKVVNCVKKVKETERQATLSLSERLKNLSTSFKVDKALVKDKSILLIDDVLTTGATADILSKLLKKAGATKVIVLTVASVSKH